MSKVLKDLGQLGSEADTNEINENGKLSASASKIEVGAGNIEQQAEQSMVLIQE